MQHVVIFKLSLNTKFNHCPVACPSEWAVRTLQLPCDSVLARAWFCGAQFDIAAAAVKLYHFLCLIPLILVINIIGVQESILTFSYCL
mgnify:CR=1 FL=1